jgi:two-component system, sensor histidine kinase and response regulator
LNITIPNLILCDVNMPELDGHDVLRRLRMDTLTANIPFIFLTSNAARPDVRSGMELGASDYLTKPVRADELVKAINMQMAKTTIAKRQADEMLNQLRNNINLALPHELHTPLNGILGSADLLIHDHDDLDDAERLELAHQIRTSAMRLYHLTRNFLLYAELEMMSTSPDRPSLIRQNRRRLVQRPISHTAYQCAEKYHRSADLHLADCQGGVSDADADVRNGDWLCLWTSTVTGAICLKSSLDCPCLYPCLYPCLCA